MGQIRFTSNGVDMTPPILSGASAAAQGTNAASWSVTSNEAGGTIFAAARPSSAGTLSRPQIEAGTGAAVATGTDANPSAAGNGGTLNGLSPSTTYRIDIFQRDASGNESAVRSTAGFTTNSAGGATVNIEILQQSGLAAPQGAFFEADVAGFGVTETLDLAQYDDSFAMLRYRWTITRQGQSYAPQASDKVDNLPAIHNDTNTAYGKRIGHVFTEPGVYTITCEVRNSAGLTGIGSTTLTVADPDSVFSGNRTILLGGANGAYPGAQVVGSVSAAVSALNGLGQTGRILVQRGSTHANNDFEFSGGADNIYIGTYGSGNRPVIGQAGSHGIRLNGSFQGHAQIVGLEIAGGWESTTETGNGGGLGIRCFDTSNEQYIVVSDCEIHGWGEGISSPRADNVNVAHATYVHNCNIYGNRFYAGIGIVPIAIGSFYCATGNYLGSQVQDMMGGPKDGNYNNHGSIRIAAMRYAYLACNDMFTRCGWNPTTAVPTAKGPFIQSCIRWNTSNVQGTSGVFERNALESGFAYSAGGSRSYGSNLLVEKNLIVGHSSQRDMLTIESPGLTFRNNICVHPNAPTSTNNGKRIVAGGPLNGTPQFDPDWPVEIYSNTAVIQVSDANRNGIDFDAWEISGFPNLEVDNNIVDAPNATGQLGTPDTSGSSAETGLNLSQDRMPTVGGLHDPRWAGVKWRASSAANGQQLTMDATYASPANSVTEFYPGPGSTARSSASGVCAIDDFYGVLRPLAVGNRARGAVEPV